MKPKRGECLKMADQDYNYYIRGHGLTDDEIWNAIDALNRENDGEDFAEADADTIRTYFKIQMKREEWYRWGLCTCGEEHERDLYDAQPHSRGAFPITFVIIKIRQEEIR